MAQHWLLDHLRKNLYLVGGFPYVLGAQKYFFQIFTVYHLEMAAIFVLGRTLFFAFAGIYDFLNYTAMGYPSPIR